jgi:transposase-like protein
MKTSGRLARPQPLHQSKVNAVRPRRDFRALEARRMRAVDLFEQGVRPAEIARQVGVGHQTVSDWRTVWRQCGRAGLRAAGCDFARYLARLLPG